MSPAVARFLLDLLNRQQLAVGAADFDDNARLVAEAKRALLAIMDGVYAPPT